MIGSSRPLIVKSSHHVADFSLQSLVPFLISLEQTNSPFTEISCHPWQQACVVSKDDLELFEEWTGQLRIFKGNLLVKEALRIIYFLVKDLYSSYTFLWSLRSHVTNVWVKDPNLTK